MTDQTTLIRAAVHEAADRRRRAEADLSLAKRINEALPECRRMAQDMDRYGHLEDDESEMVEQMIELLEEAAGRLMLRTEEPAQ